PANPQWYQIIRRRCGVLSLQPQAAAFDGRGLKTGQRWLKGRKASNERKTSSVRLGRAVTDGVDGQIRHMAT
ncbi:MAG: hypothetical protein WCO56_10735, partial [Verrucomicrobiota bacterium]